MQACESENGPGFTVESVGAHTPPTANNASMGITVDNGIQVVYLPKSFEPTLGSSKYDPTETDSTQF